MADNIPNFFTQYPQTLGEVECCFECEKETTKDDLRVIDGRYFPITVLFCSFTCMNLYWPKTAGGQKEAAEALKKLNILDHGHELQ
jgi:hypothetical protein